MNQNVSRTAPRSTAPYHEQAPPYYVRHDAATSATLTTTLVHALSDVTGVDATDAEDALAEHLDLDALERLFRAGSDGGDPLQSTFGFTLWGYRVTVYSGGSIVITPPPSWTDSRSHAPGPAGQPPQGP